MTLEIIWVSVFSRLYKFLLNKSKTYKLETKIYLAHYSVGQLTVLV